MTTPLPLPKVAFIMQLKVTFAPENRELFLSHFKPTFDLVSAEPECAFFIVGEDMQQPGTYRWTEGWTKDVGWFMSVQMKKPYYEPYLKATEPLFTAERIVEMYAPLEGLGFVKLDVAK